jgi:hypothetical protein
MAKKKTGASRSGGGGKTSGGSKSKAAKTASANSATEKSASATPWIKCTFFELCTSAAAPLRFRFEAFEKPDKKHVFEAKSPTDQVGLARKILEVAKIWPAGVFEVQSLDDPDADDPQITDVRLPS